MKKLNTSLVDLLLRETRENQVGSQKQIFGELPAHAEDIENILEKYLRVCKVDPTYVILADTTSGRAMHGNAKPVDSNDIEGEAYAIVSEINRKFTNPRAVGYRALIDPMKSLRIDQDVPVKYGSPEFAAEYDDMYPSSRSGQYTGD